MSNAYLCNHMMLQSGGGTWDTGLYTVRGVGSGSRDCYRDVDVWRANGCTPRIWGSKYRIRHRIQIVMFRTIRVDHTNCLRVPIKIHSFSSRVCPFCPDVVLFPVRTSSWYVYYESIKWEVHRRLMYECRCDERLNSKSEGRTSNRKHKWYSVRRVIVCLLWIDKARALGLADKTYMSVGVMKDYKLKLRDLRASHTLGWSWNWNT
jgi:hypothetical protein